MVQLSPNTGNFTWDDHSGYQFNDSTLRGFAHTHLSGGGNPVPGDLLILPFSKEKEEASPGDYGTFLKDKIKVELTATHRTGVHQ